MELRRVGPVYLARYLVASLERPWLGACLLVAAALLLFRVSPGLTPGIAHDSFQYLSVAQQAVHGSFGTTTLVHFDAERSFGTVPAPMVTFPLGYPATIALLQVAGLPPTTAALLVNAAALLGCLTLLWWLTARLEFAPVVRAAVVGTVALNGALVQSAATIATEMLFTLLIVGCLGLLLRAHRSGRVAAWLVAGLVLGVAYHVRYAGLFMTVALIPVALRYAVRRNTAALARGYAVAIGGALALIAVGMARNVVLVGNWRGGNEKAVHNEFWAVVYQSVRSFATLLLGGYTGAPAVLHVARLGAFLLVLAAALWLVWRRIARTDGTPVAPAPGGRPSLLVDVAIITAVYAVLMFYAGLTTVISYGTRMFVPIVPLLALLAGALAHAVLREARAGGAGSRLAKVALTGFLVAYVPLNLLSLRQPRVDRLTVVAEQMDAGSGSGTSVRSVIDGLGGPGRAIVANNGQAIGHVLGRPTVSLVGPKYSVVEWTESALREVVERYRATAVVVTAPNPRQPDDPDLVPSAFVRELTHGRAPSWMSLALRSGDVLVFVPTAGADSTYSSAPQ